MKIHQYYTHNDLRNFNYIIQSSDKTALVIDPWDAAEISSQLKSLDLNLKAIINTHEHWDHIQGNSALVMQYGCEVWAHENGQGKIPGLTRCLQKDEIIELDGTNQLLVLDTPGHTFAHLCFVLQQDGKAKAVFTGDTLFNAGVGHCRGGDAETLYETISQQFQTLADEVMVYPGHDYLENNLKFTLNFEPNNQQAQQWLKRIESTDYQPGSIQTTIGNEKSFNTFMRLGNLDIIKSLGLDSPQQKEVFLALRSKRDNW